MEKYWSPADINSVVRNELIDIFPELTYKFMSEVDSTNGLLKTWAYEDKIKPVFLLLAGRQNAGRGRKKRQWYSPPRKGLYFSLLFNPAVKSQHLYLYTMISSLAVQESLVSHGYKARIKWPNDIMLNGRKVSGILSELMVMNHDKKEKRVIVGIGINTHINSYPKYLQDKATSLLLAKNQSPAAAQIFKEIITKLINYHYSLQKEKRINKLREKWLNRLNLKGEIIKIYTDESSYLGKVKDISRRGELIVSTKEGQKLINSNDIEIMNNQ